MYKIIGADAQEYGPVSGDKIREWIKEGRVNSQTKIKAEGEGEWKTFSQLAEFADVQVGTAPTPPVLAPGTTAPSKLSALAILSLVLGILGWITLGLTALVGLVLGIIALVRISRSQGALRGKGLALAGTIVSGVFVLMLPIMAAMLLPALAQAKSRAQSIMCMNNLKQIGLAEMLYAGDNKDRFPSGGNWCDAIGKYVGSPAVFKCPVGAVQQRCHYAFNARLSGVDTKSISNPAQTVLVFETDGGWNLSGGPELTLSQTRHRNAVGIVFADGHSELATPARLQKARWDP